ncbi:hypothetical protein [Halorussus litoreus]|uniref:hypothetical protein n=1 Tax=Halorussus litoreus TaxID=1710536 RepID=UPI000E21D9FD|nr:hypothetical protein [Halorussus litoreus]
MFDATVSNERIGSEDPSRPARQTETARIRRRTSWHGHGERTTTVAFVVGAFPVGLFPRVADSFYAVVEQ